MARPGFTIGETTIEPGSRASVRLPLPNQSTYTPMFMPVYVIHGKKDGPRLFVSAALHGDEINGVEVIRRLLRRKILNRLRGTLVLVPIVNVYGFINHSRYLPDGRDLNRSFPGSERGSLASRLAFTFTRDILGNCSHGIDLHTGGGHRTNHPHVRGNMDDPDTAAMAEAFGAPVIINANLRDGSLRQVAGEMGIKALLYEAGGALRFEELPVRAGIRGIVNVMRHLGMLPARQSSRHAAAHAASSHWLRASTSGILASDVALGQRVAAKERLGTISDAFGEQVTAVPAREEGIVIGRTNLPVVNEGDALFHIARFEDAGHAESALEAFYDRNLEGLGSGDYAIRSE